MGLPKTPRLFGCGLLFCGLILVYTCIYSKRVIIPGKDGYCLKPGCLDGVALARTSTIQGPMPGLNITEINELRRKYLSHLHFTDEQRLSTDGVSAQVIKLYKSLALKGRMGWLGG